MSNILKSKSFFGVMIVAVVVVAFSMLAMSAFAMTVGSKGADVMSLQTSLGVTPASGFYGKITKAAVIAFQKAHGLVADGVAGPKTLAAIAAGTPASASFPAGCASASGFSSTTGMPCSGGSTLPAGCTSTSGYSVTTGMPCNSGSTLPAGCTSTAGYSSTTGNKCDSGSTVSTSGAGDLSLALTTSDIDSPAPEGQTTMVGAFKATATGSDISVTNVKVTLQNTTPNATSTRLDHYASEVSVWMGSTKVGTAMVSAFTKDGTTYSASIPLSGAMVKVGTANKQTFYVSVTANTTMDSADATGNNGTDNHWTVTAAQVRFTDGTGLTLTDNSLGGQIFTFGKITTSGDLKLSVSTSTSNPKASTQVVSDTGSTSDILMNEFSMKPKGADMTMTALGINVTTTGTGTATQIAQQLVLKANGVQVATIDTVAGGANATTANVFTLDNDLVMTMGSTVKFDIYAKTNKIGTGTFAQGDSMLVSYFNTGTAVETTLGGSSVTSLITGSSVGNAQTFRSKGMSATLVGTPTFTVLKGLTTKPDIGTASITFDVTAFGSDIYLDATKPDMLDVTTAAGANYVIIIPGAGGTGTQDAVITSPSGATLSGVQNADARFFIAQDTTQRFTITSVVTPTVAGGLYSVKIGSLHYALTDVTGTTKYTTNLTDFVTPSGNLVLVN